MIKRALVASIAMILGLVAGPAAAQTARIDVSGGYQVTRATDQTLPAGWNAGLRVNLTDAWAAVGEVGGSYKTVTMRISASTSDCGSTASAAERAGRSAH